MPFNSLRNKVFIFLIFALFFILYFHFILDEKGANDMNKGVNKFLIVTIFFVFALIFMSSTFSKDTYSHTVPACCEGYTTYAGIDNGNTCVKVLKTTYETSNLSNSTNIACYTYEKKVCCQKQEKNSETNEFFTVYRGGSSCNSSETETDLSKCGNFACYTYEKQPENCATTQKTETENEQSSLDNDTSIDDKDTSDKKTSSSEAVTTGNHPVPRDTDKFADDAGNGTVIASENDTMITIPYKVENTLKDDGTLVSYNISGCNVNMFAKIVIGINAINKINQQILIKNMQVKDDVSFKAGTSVGLSIYEQHIVSWAVGDNDACKKSEVTKAIIDKAKKEYGSFLSKDKANYQLVLSDSNDANSLDNTIIQNKEGYCVETPDGASLMGCAFELRPSKICIDYKTGNVKYDVTDCSDNFTEYPSDQLYWQYFIPLNATNDFSFVIEKMDNDKYSRQECENIIRTNYNNYYNFVSYDNINYVSHSLNTALSQVNGGCYIKPKIIIPTNQYFYYLSDDNTKISGLNFYFRKINPSNPFPKPVTNLNSLWYDWYMDHYDTDDRYDKSEKVFNNEAYAIDIDASKKENIDNVSYDYMSWEDIELSGRSKFVLDLFEKTPDLNLASGANKYSKLGCGIINSMEYLDDEKLIINPYYLERCAG